MNVLIQTREVSSEPEIREFTESNGDVAFISHSSNESIAFLSKISINKAVISLKNLNDAAILKYLNENHPTIEVVVIANKAMDEMISTFQKANYSVVHEPLRLAELKTQLKLKQNTPD